MNSQTEPLKAIPIQFPVSHTPCAIYGDGVLSAGSWADPGIFSRL